MNPATILALIIELYAQAQALERKNQALRAELARLTADDDAGD